MTHKIAKHFALLVLPVLHWVERRLVESHNTDPAVGPHLKGLQSAIAELEQKVSA